jgi:hypothetical protein
VATLPARVRRLKAWRLMVSASAFSAVPRMDRSGCIIHDVSLGRIVSDVVVISPLINGASKAPGQIVRSASTDPADPRIAEFTSMRDRDLAGRGDRFIAEGRVVLQALTDALDDADAARRRAFRASRRCCSWKTGWMVLARTDGSAGSRIVRSMWRTAKCWTLRWGSPCIAAFLPCGRHLPPPSLGEFLVRTAGSKALACCRLRHCQS